MAIALLKKTLLVFVFVAAAGNASAQWALNNAASTVDFISIKNDQVAESHHFKQLQGSISKNGTASVTIALTSVETMIPIRNERMQSMLFEVEKFPQAIVSTAIEFNRISGMKAGQSFVQPAKLELSVHGQQHQLDAELRVVKLRKNKLLITTVKPIIVNAADFALGKGVEALKNVAKLTSISTAVPVTVSLVFEK